MAEKRAYDPKEIEEKWQKRWEAEGVYEAEEGGDKAYVLDMFPYPSGAGLHVGHPKGYIATDAYSRLKRMQGKNVLHPMGWDAFGLPAEQYALANKVHPRKAVAENVARFKEQLSKIGLDYDWSREVNTTDPSYYRWTQWIFLQLFKKGLAYESYAPINWCPSCQTGLANEDLEGGKCERCGSEVEKRPMRQWVLKITDYADRMLEDLDLLTKWPEHIKEMQRHWIGRKEGVIVRHAVPESDLVLESFSAYPAWLFADTYLVMAPEHPLVKDLVEGLPEEKEVHAFVTKIGKQAAEERREDKEKLGVFTGRYVTDPLRGTPMPVWLANFALMDFGTGVIRCSAHDERDVEFATKYGIPLRKVVDAGSDSFVNAHDNTGTLEDSGPFTGRVITSDLALEMAAWIEEQGFGKRHVSYRLQDWVFSRQRYWGEPIPLVHCEKDGVVAVPESELPVTLPDVEHYEPAGTGESPLAAISGWVNTTCPSCGGPAKRETNTMPQWAGSCWYYLRYMDPHNDQALVDPSKEKAWAPVDLYVGGAEHATRHLIYARFWHKFLFDQGVVSTPEPFTELHSVGLILAEDGRKMSKRFGNVVNPDDVINEWGADAFRTYEMFMGPFKDTIAWSTKGLAGPRRFIEKVWYLQYKIEDGSLDDATERLMHQTIKKVGEDIEGFAFNTAISSLMIYTNALHDLPAVPKKAYENLVLLLAPFAPHVADELWELMGQESTLQKGTWPSYDQGKLASDTVTVVVQVIGKKKGEVNLPRDASESDALAAARNAFGEAIPQSPSRIVYVANRILNLIP